MSASEAKEASKSSSTEASHQREMYLVLFVTDYRKENESKAHKVFGTFEAAMEEAKKFTNPPAPFKEMDQEEEGMEHADNISTYGNTAAWKTRFLSTSAALLLTSQRLMKVALLPCRGRRVWWLPW